MGDVVEEGDSTDADQSDEGADEENHEAGHNTLEGIIAIGLQDVVGDSGKAHQGEIDGNSEGVVVGTAELQVSEGDDYICHKSRGRNIRG
jgi:hypothetical protein